MCAFSSVLIGNKYYLLIFSFYNLLSENTKHDGIISLWPALTNTLRENILISGIIYSLNHSFMNR